MPSLAKIFSFAAVAFGAFALAAPTVDVGGAIQARDHAVVDIVERTTCDTCIPPGVPTLPIILVNLRVKVKADIRLLTEITKETCRVEVIKPIVARICGHIEVATNEVLVLRKYKLHDILFDGRVVINVHILAKLIVGLFVDICGALTIVLKIIGGAKNEIYWCLYSVGVALERLLYVIIDICGSIVVDLLHILSVDLKLTFSVIVRLGLLNLCSLLGINIHIIL
jgi:hypothetical protein